MVGTDSKKGLVMLLEHETKSIKRYYDIIEEYPELGVSEELVKEFILEQFKRIEKITSLITKDIKEEDDDEKGTEDK